MKSYWCADSVETKPDLTKLTSFGYPTDGNPEQGFEATLPGAAWFYLVSLMRSQIISACSKTEDPKLENQYLECLRSFDWALENSIDGSKIKTATIGNDRIKQGVIAFDRLAAAAIATEEQAVAGTADNVLMTPEMVAKAIAALIPPAMPTGMIFPWPGDTPPEGSIVADGRELSRTTYAGLFSIFGTSTAIRKTEHNGQTGDICGSRSAVVLGRAICRELWSPFFWWPRYSINRQKYSFF